MSARIPGAANPGGDRPTAESPGSRGGGRGEGQGGYPKAEGSPSQEGPEEPKALEPQPKCDICGITTTSQAHMEVRIMHLILFGRAHNVGRGCQ